VIVPLLTATAAEIPKKDRVKTLPSLGTGTSLHDGVQAELGASLLAYYLARHFPHGIFCLNDRQEKKREEYIKKPAKYLSKKPAKCLCDTIPATLPRHLNSSVWLPTTDDDSAS
jgi:hypothetical protein